MQVPVDEVEDEEECPACFDVSDDEPYYGECCACGKLDPRGAK